MGIVSRLGRWLDIRFPEKVSAEDVYTKFTAIELRLHDLTTLDARMNAGEEIDAEHSAKLVDLAKKLEQLTSENTALKAQAALRTRISSIPIPGR